MSLWQTQSWQDMLIASGQSEEYFMIEQDVVAASSLLNQGDKGRKEGNDYSEVEAQQNGERSKGAIFVEKRRVSLGEYGLFVIGLEGEYDEDLRESLEDLCREEKCLFLQVETIDYFAASSLLNEGDKGRKEGNDYSEVEAQQNGERSEKIELNNKYYKKFIPTYTALIDLTLGEEEILKAMKPKGRYNIKLARKKGVVVEQVEKHIGNIKKFHALMSETTQRDNFAGNTLEYYKIFLESLDNAQMFFAYHEEEIIAAGIFVIEDNVMTYYYGASSSSEKRKYMPTYLLQWAAIEHAMKRGCKIYDFLGVAGDDEKNSRLSGVTDFKMKLSPKKTLVSQASIYVNKKWKYQVIKGLRKLKK